MGFVEAVRTCLTKFVTFSGRARRPEFWWFWLACILAGAVAGVLDGAIFGPGTVTTETVSTAPDGTAITSLETAVEYGGGPIGGLVALVTFAPLLAAAWRRVHDAGKPGWIAVAHLPMLFAGAVLAALAGLVGLVVIVAALIWGFYVLYLLLKPSESGANRFGGEASA